MDIPRHLQHKPIIGVDYQHIDKYGDAKYLSIGKAQWDYKDISAKTFRYADTRWSPQSEELQLWRLLDLTILVVSVILNTKSDTFEPQSKMLNEEVVDEQGFEDLKNYLKSTDCQKLLYPRLKELKELLNRMEL